VECRSVSLGKRRFFYVVNHGRTPVVLRLKSKWDLSRVVDLRTGEAGLAKKLGPLEFHVYEVK
jgi:hypothetical protein